MAVSFQDKRLYCSIVAMFYNIGPPNNCLLNYFQGKHIFSQITVIISKHDINWNLSEMKQSKNVTKLVGYVKLKLVWLRISTDVTLLM